MGFDARWRRDRHMAHPSGRSSEPRCMDSVCMLRVNEKALPRPDARTSVVPRSPPARRRRSATRL